MCSVQVTGLRTCTVASTPRGLSAGARSLTQSTAPSPKGSLPSGVGACPCQGCCHLEDRWQRSSGPQGAALDRAGFMATACQPCRCLQLGLFRGPWGHAPTPERGGDHRKRPPGSASLAGRVVSGQRGHRLLWVTGRAGVASGLAQVPQVCWLRRVSGGCWGVRRPTLPVEEQRLGGHAHAWQFSPCGGLGTVTPVTEKVAG